MAVIELLLGGLAILVPILIWKWRSVDSVWEREEYFRDRYEGKRLDDGHLHPLIDSIQGYESKSPLRYVRRYLLFQTTGGMRVALRFERHTLDETVWSGRLFDETLGDEGVEFLNTRNSPGMQSVTILRIPTADRDGFDIRLNQIGVYLNAIISEGVVSVTPYNGQ
ncbi:hypothetical protein [Haloferax volcanii]|uniref:hypothetical protein n=1 Tax=Haloferax volcanii TaxID=2246 RepID=UPI00385B4D16